jgi:ATP-dependent DNA helicase RecQ
MVAAGKHAGHFDDALVEAVLMMIKKRWVPDPFPQWVACVASLRHPTLVPDFAKRVAEGLGIPFLDVVFKARDNEAQKLQNNSWHQCRNLDGAFRINGVVPPEPALLIDDIVDSGWTLTVVGALLRQAGVSRVYPLALATTAAGG